MPEPASRCRSQYQRTSSTTVPWPSGWAGSPCSPRSCSAALARRRPGLPGEGRLAAVGQRRRRRRRPCPLLPDRPGSSSAAATRWPRAVRMFRPGHTSHWHRTCVLIFDMLDIAVAAASRSGIRPRGGKDGTDDILARPHEAGGQPDKRTPSTAADGSSGRPAVWDHGGLRPARPTDSYPHITCRARRLPTSQQKPDPPAQAARWR